MKSSSGNAVRLFRLMKSSMSQDRSGLLLVKKLVLALRMRVLPYWWNPQQKVTSATNATPLNFKSVVFLVHIHYDEQADHALDFVSALPSDAQVIVTTTSRTLAETAQAAQSKGVHKLALVRNRGRNFGPLLDALSELEDWEYLVHLHTKRSVDAPGAFGKRWNSALWQELGSPERAMKAVNMLHQNPRVGIVYPDVSHVVSWLNFNWNENEVPARKLLESMSLTFPKGPVAFPAGGMFAVKKAAILPLLALNLRSSDMPDEPIPVDGTILHALERLVGVVPTIGGYDHLVMRQGEFYADTSYIYGPKSAFAAVKFRQRMVQRLVESHGQDFDPRT